MLWFANPFGGRIFIPYGYWGSIPQIVIESQTQRQNLECNRCDEVILLLLVRIAENYELQSDEKVLISSLTFQLSDQSTYPADVLLLKVANFLMLLLKKKK